MNDRRYEANLKSSRGTFEWLEAQGEEKKDLTQKLQGRRGSDKVEIVRMKPLANPTSWTPGGKVKTRTLYGKTVKHVAPRLAPWVMWFRDSER